MSDKIQMLPVPTDIDHLSEFSQDLIRKVAEASGVTYEQLSRDYNSVDHAIFREWLRVSREAGVIPLYPKANVD